MFLIRNIMYSMISRGRWLVQLSRRAVSAVVGIRRPSLKWIE